MNEPETGSRVRPGRALAAPAAALAALLAVVAIASAARLGDSGDGGPRLSLPEGYFAWFYALFLVLGAIAFPFFVYISTRTSPYDKSGRRRAGSHQTIVQLRVAMFEEIDKAAVEPHEALAAIEIFKP